MGGHRAAMDSTLCYVKRKRVVKKRRVEEFGGGYAEVIGEVGEVAAKRR